MNQILWRPSAEAAAATQIAALARARGFEGEDAIARLWHWSIEHPAEFWQDVWDLGEIKASRKADAVLADRERMPGARWFGGARLNLAENLLRRDDDTPALANDERVMSGRRPSERASVAEPSTAQRPLLPSSPAPSIGKARRASSRKEPSKAPTRSAASSSSARV